MSTRAALSLTLDVTRDARGDEHIGPRRRNAPANRGKEAREESCQDEIAKDKAVTFEVGTDPKSGKIKAVSVESGLTDG
jgi:hypothetical protein